MMNKQRGKTRLLITIFLINLAYVINLSYANASGDEFPGRKLYPAVKYITIKDLKNKLNEVVVVDVRSKYEYQTLRIKGARHIAISNKKFVHEMKQLRAKVGDKDIVVYCNGKTCMKSYKAASKCQDYDVNGVVAYDAGIMDWAKIYPHDSVLLGKSPIDTDDLIIRKKFNSYLLTPDEFEKQFSKKKSIVVDLRDSFQRDATGIYVGLEVRINIDDKKALKTIIEKAKKEEKALFIYDAAGKQIRWLMYFLEANNTKEYYFMKGGARGYFKSLQEKYTS
ncbi:hypothetical protein MNBD_GAMMA25-1930 [hydrothermal vent metagenome]|uniref:Rhodanese domain-containing protein n=1 Tax=hydrothermal vent metagenome TaxID=652676 RepID=A0A3B1BPG4_9ZZZZ